MPDIAEIGFRADSSQLREAKASLDAIAPSAKNVETAANRLGDGLKKVSDAAGAVGPGATAAANGIDTLSKSAELANASMGKMQKGVALNSTTVRELLVVSRELAAGNTTRLVGSLSILLPQLVNASHGGLTFSNVLGGIAKQFGLVRTQLRASAGEWGAEAISEAKAASAAQGLMASLAGRAEAAVIAADAELTLALKSAELATSDTALAAAEARVAAAHEAVALAAGEATIADMALAEANTAAGIAGKRAADAQVSAFTPLARIIGGVAIFVGALAAAFGLAARQIRKDNGDVTDGMELTKKQAATLKDHLERLKDNKIDIHVTGMDSLKGFFKTLKDGVGDSGIGSAWSSTLDAMTTAGIAFLHGFYGALQGTNDAIVATWRELPAAFGDVFIQSLNYAIDGYNAIVTAGWNFLALLGRIIMNIPTYISNAFHASVSGASMGMTAIYNLVVSAISGMLAHWREWPIAIARYFYEAARNAFNTIATLFNATVTFIKHLMTGDFGHISNPFAGAAAKAGTDGAKAFAEGYHKAGNAIDEFGRKWSANSRRIAQDRIMKEVGTPGSTRTPRARKGPKTDEEKFADIVTGAENEIDKENAKAAAAGMDLTAEAAAALTYKTKLLNEVDTKKIVLTAAMARKIDELAEAYGRAKVAADNANGLHAVLKTGDADIANIKAQADMIGIYGRQLAYATEMAKLLAEAKAKNMTPDAISAAMPKFADKADIYADASAGYQHDAFMEDERKTAAERLITLQQERDAVGLNADATTQLRIENELLAAARKKNIDLTPEDIAGMKQIAVEQAAIENATRKAKEALDFAKGAAKGFISDLKSGLEQGKGFFQSFLSAVMGVLNKIFDKLVDVAIEAAFSKGGGSGGGIGSIGQAIGNFIGSLFHAKGNAFDANGISKFAAGGMFTNSIVDRPTPFTFARGAALGVMGEAGPEAIVPLKRGGDGSLGVQMYGGRGSGGNMINAPVTINNDNRVTGAVSSQDIVDMQRAQAEKTKQDVKHSLIPWINEYQMTGTMVS